MKDLKSIIRTVPDFPKKGINFFDITTLLSDPEALRDSVSAICDHWRDRNVDAVAAVEARGFIFGACVAMELGAAFVPMRKPGKLPYETTSASYELEYGTDTIEMHVDAVPKGARILLVDDLLATGGTMKAAAELVRGAGGEVAGCAFVIELSFLHGRDKLTDLEVQTLVDYDSE